MVISAVGNITILVVLSRRRQKTPSRIDNMLMHLAIADLLVRIQKQVLFVYYKFNVFNLVELRNEL